MNVDQRIIWARHVAHMGNSFSVLSYIPIEFHWIGINEEYGFWARFQFSAPFSIIPISIFLRLGFVVSRTVCLQVYLSAFWFLFVKWRLVPWGFQEVEAPIFQDNRHMKVVRLSALRTVASSPQEIPGTHFCSMLSRPLGHSAAGRIMSMKNSNYTIGNRTCDLPACSLVP